MKRDSENPARPVTVAMRLYRAVARAFPSEFRNAYGDEMLQAGEDAVQPTWRRSGLAGLFRLLLDVAVRLPVEYASELRQDVKTGARMLARSPGFTSVALISLALGIGVAASAYSEMNGLLRELPGVLDPNDLVAVHKPISFPTYDRFRQLNDLFSDSAAYVGAVPLVISAGNRTERAWAHLVTPSYFRVFGTEPALGRFFDASLEHYGHSPATVVSHPFWENHLGSDPLIVGKTIRVNGRPCTVIGVSSKEFLGASPALFPADVWLPATSDPLMIPELGGGALEQPDRAMFQMVARLQPGVGDDRAAAELNAVAEQLAEFYRNPAQTAQSQKAQRIVLLGGGKIIQLRKQDVPYFRQFLLVMGGLLLIIACANVANMMLARAADRRREIAVRLAVGASRARIIRQLLTESVLLAAAAAPFALLFCIWVMHNFSQMKMPLPIPVTVDMHPDWRALAFVGALALSTALAFGLAPALRAARADLAPALKEGGDARLRRYRAFSLRNGLMFSQMAASLMLLMMTGYLGLGIQSTLGLQEGFNAKNLYLVSVDPIRDGQPPGRARALLERILDQVSASPAVSSVALSDTLPASVDGNAGVSFYTAAARADESRESHWAKKHVVGRRYFETADIRILSGREFEKRDESDGAFPVIVSQEAVRRFWNGENPVGRRIELTNSDVTGTTGLWPGTFDYRADMLSKAVRAFEVIGVAADVSEDLVASKKHPAMYFPLRPAGYAQPSVRGLTLMVRGAPGVDVIGLVRREIESVDPRIMPFNARTMIEHIDQFMSVLKAASWTYAALGIFGLVLASVGLAGITAYSVAKRGHEIGIRMALGAQTRDVLRLVMKEGAALVVLGSAAGLLLALAGIRAMSAVFFTVATVKTFDPVLLVGAPLLLASLAMVACYIPARRSTTIDPATTLRAE